MASYGVYCGLDRSRGDEHAVALNRGAKRLHDGPLPKDEQQLRALFEMLGRHGRLLVVVDQPATIGAFPVTVARAGGVDVAYLPRPAIRRRADPPPGPDTSEAPDALAIAEAARLFPQSLRRLDVGGTAWAELAVLVRSDDDLAQGSTRLISRIRDLLTHIHPALERAIGPRLDSQAAVELLARYGGPAGLRRAGQRKLTATALTHAPGAGAGLDGAIVAALNEPGAIVAGTAAAEAVLPRLADALRDVHRGRAEVAAQVEEILYATLEAAA